MKTLKPIHAAVLVVIISSVVLVTDYALEGGFSRADYERVGPDDQGLVTIDVSDLANGTVRFFRFLNYGNQEVLFFVGRDQHGTVQVAFDANEICYKLKRGYRHQEEWVVCNKCDKAFRLAEVNDGDGGCKPVPLPHRLRGDQLILVEADILTGWRFFR